MTKNRKILATSFAGILVTGAAAATVVACSSNTASSNVLTVQAEAEWVTTYQAVIDAFKEDNAALLTENGVDDIVVLERNSFEMLDLIEQNGVNDSGIADLFVAPGDRFSGLIGGNLISPFNETSLDAYRTAYLGTDTFIQTVIDTAAYTTQNSMLYGVPDRIEGLVTYEVTNSNSSETSTLTKFSDLWYSAGFFNGALTNSNNLNLRDIVEFDLGAQAVVNKAVGTSTEAIQWQNFLSNGFANMMNAIGSGFDTVDTTGNDRSSNIAATTILAVDSSVHEAPLFQLFNQTQDISTLIAGPWLTNSIQEQLDSGETITPTSTIDSYSQWTGGWSFAMNFRVSDAEKNVLESLIASLVSSEYADDIAPNKFSATSNGVEVIVGSGADYSGDGSLDTVNEQVAEQVYSSSFEPRPFEAAFNSVWNAFATTMQAEANNFVDAVISGNTAYSQAIANVFIAAISTGITV